MGLALAATTLEKINTVSIVHKKQRPLILLLVHSDNSGAKTNAYATLAAAIFRAAERLVMVCFTDDLDILA